MTTKPNYPPKVGELRPSQILFTYGVGAIVDLPYLSALVMGLEDWPTDPGIAREIHEDRLLQAVRWELGSTVQKLLSPPEVPETSGMPDPFGELARVGVPVAAFPRWLLCPKCQILAPLGTGLFELSKVEPFRPDRTRYVHVNCPKANKPPAVPARFLVACEKGHLDDFPWREFVHSGPTECHGSLRLIEYGPSGEARDLEVRCDGCGKSRRLAQAFGESGRATMPLCRGRRPHLRDYDDQGCDQQVRAILLGASNLWFPDVLTTLAIPTESARLAQLVEDKWAILKNVQNLQGVELLRAVGMLGELHGYANDEIWATMERKRQAEESGGEQAIPPLKQPEWEILTHPDSRPGTADFRLKQVRVPQDLESVLDKVILVEKLREVRALIGFTRLEAPGEFGETPEEEAEGPQRMRLSRRAPTWLPAAEVRGEGIFLQFKESAIQRWLQGSRVQQRENYFLDSHTRWRQARGIKPAEGGFPGVRYVMLHSFAHTLMRQFALECGYTAASVRERIYSRNPGELDDYPEPTAGVLIYTAAPDSEGPLGGLVSLGEPDELRRHILTALRDAELCASDPLCAEHVPSIDGVTLHAAACHACLFAPETSCERGNKYLDRSLLIPTIEYRDLAFFHPMIFDDRNGQTHRSAPTQED